MSFITVFCDNSIQTLPLDAEKVFSIGRDERSDIVLRDTLVSRNHARLQFAGSRWHVEDCGSRNRLQVNQVNTQSEALVSGDLIRIGDSILLFSDAELKQKNQRKLEKTARNTTTIARLDMESAFHPNMGNQVQKAAIEDTNRAGLLAKLATLAQIVKSTEQLFDIAVNNIKKVTEARIVRVWLRGPNGRLHLATQKPATKKNVTPTLFASLAIENSQAMLFGDKDVVITNTDNQEDPGGSGVIAAIIPGADTIRGAIECYSNQQSSFSFGDLEFLAAVCNLIGPSIQNIEHIQNLETRNNEMRGQKQSLLIGDSLCMRSLQKRIQQVASADTTILITGETGTGKELAARTIHESSRRRSGPMITVNCAAFSEGLLESELFGHEKGAFTGADRRRIGAFERADGGTLFLDEIGEMSLSCQAKVLRVMEHYPFERVGGSEPVQIDVRIVAATHRDLSQLVAEQKFREDLMYRLQIIELEIPALRERGDDITALAQHFIEFYRYKFGKPPMAFTDEALVALSEYHWPGNVRELRNMMERAVVLSNSPKVTSRDFHLKQDLDQSFPMAGLHSMQEMENRYIRFVMDSVNENKTEACKILGISRATLYKKLSMTVEVK